MGFSRFSTQLAVRIVLLTVTIAVAVGFALTGEYPVTAAVCGVLAVLQAVWLYVYVQGTERDLARFFEAISHDSFDLVFPSHRSASARRVHTAFAGIIENFRQVRAQREAHYQYLQTVIHHVGIGLIAYDENGMVDLCNFAALRLFGLEALHNLNQLEPSRAGIGAVLLGLPAAERRAITIQGAEGQAELLLHATKFRRQGTTYTLVSLQNISRELEEREMETWQAILRSMTHEIRNSMTPIASLASTTLQMLDSPGQLCTETAVAEDARLALRTIQRRSQSLLKFVDAFRTLAHVPVPARRNVAIADLIEHVRLFFQAQLTQRCIASEFRVDPPDLTLHADPALLEQVLINLILNAMEALGHRENGMIRVHVQREERGQVKFTVSDNGPGIPDELKDKAFIPFFSTKPAGSGIGLSLSRLILRLHGATIRMTSTPNIHTTFEISFPG